MNTTLNQPLTNPTYKAAIIASAAIETHFANQLANAAARGEKNLAPEPNKRIIATIIDEPCI